MNEEDVHIVEKKVEETFLRLLSPARRTINFRILCKWGLTAEFVNESQKLVQILLPSTTNWFYSKREKDVTGHVISTTEHTLPRLKYSDLL